ncbi:glycosyltransferase family 2 protein [Aeromonas veronii]|uniref:glycosyltransferase family 2 protein n=1 Tax=Aeromonas veronii TaxID=654 RepID=UPI003BA06298
MENNKKVLSIIVLYNPDLKVLEILLHSLIGQVSEVCIVDNTPGNIKHEVLALFSGINLACIYIGLLDNKGIAKAQNIGIKHAIEHGYTHVLLLDQDSALPNNMIHDLCEAESYLLSKGVNVAAVGPAFRDEKTGKLAPAIQQDSLFVKRVQLKSGDEKPIKCDYIIASGSLIRLSVLEKVGLMLDELFIDWVDIEWGERCRFYQFYTFMIPQVIMKHSIGDGHVSVPGRDVNLHSDFRNYFIVRNAVHLQKLKTVRWNLKLSLLLKIPLYIIFFSYHSKRKFYSILLLMRGVYDGIRGNLYKGCFK